MKKFESHGPRDAGERHCGEDSQRHGRRKPRSGDRGRDDDFRHAMAADAARYKHRRWGVADGGVLEAWLDAAAAMDGEDRGD